MVHDELQEFARRMTLLECVEAMSHRLLRSARSLAISPFAHEFALLIESAEVAARRQISRFQVNDKTRGSMNQHGHRERLEPAIVLEGFEFIQGK